MTFTMETRFNYLGMELPIEFEILYGTERCEELKGILFNASNLRKNWCKRSVRFLQINFLHTQTRYIKLMFILLKKMKFVFYPFGKKILYEEFLEYLIESAKDDDLLRQMLRILRDEEL